MNKKQYRQISKQIKELVSTGQKEIEKNLLEDYGFSLKEYKEAQNKYDKA